MTDQTRLELLTAFVGDPRESAWHRAYVDARSSAQDARPVVIHDVADAPVEVLRRVTGRVALVFHVLHADEVQLARNRRRLEDVCRHQATDGHFTLAVSAFGVGYEAAVDYIFSQVGHPPPGLTRWIAGAATLEQLREQLVEWLLLVVDRCVPAPALATDSEAVLAGEMPATKAGARAAHPRRLRGMP